MMQTIARTASCELNRAEPCPCRLCGFSTREQFKRVLLGRYDISYFRCEACGSLQTEAPYWLTEAYSKNNLAMEDAGAVMRNLDCQATLFTIARALHFRKDASILDYGGGNGLLCRLLRDCGFQAKLADGHAINDFAQGFDDDGSDVEIVSAFEVAEHFANPQEDMKSIFGRAAKLCIVGTVTYQDQGPDWWYLNPRSGQHVFFYTSSAMGVLADRYDYNYLRCHDVHIFLKRPFTATEKATLRYLLSHRSLRWVRAYIAFRANYSYAVRDAGIG